MNHSFYGKNKNKDIVQMKKNEKMELGAKTGEKMNENGPKTENSLKMEESIKLNLNGRKFTKKMEKIGPELNEIKLAIRAKNEILDHKPKNEQKTENNMKTEESTKLKQNGPKLAKRMEKIGPK